MGKKAQIKAAPLYSVYGTFNKAKKLNVRVISLTRAVKKGDVWVYPSTNGNKSVLVNNLNQVSFINNIRVGYCLKSGINKLVAAVNASHARANAGESCNIPSKKAEVINVNSSAKVRVPIKPKPVSNVSIAVELPIKKSFSAIDKADIEAVNAILSGHKEQFTVIYKRYYPIINFKYSSSLKFNKELADDLTADLFVKVYNNLDSYKPNFTFNSWITSVAKNLLIDYVRKPKLDTVSINQGVASEQMKNDDSAPILVDMRDESFNPEEDIIFQQKSTILKEHVKNLDNTCREIITMLYFEEKSYSEIADETGLSLGSVKSIIFRAKAKLKSMISEDKSTLAALVV